MGEELENHLYNQNQPVELIIEYGEFAPGTQLWGEILEKITSSDISIFDISENNPNVLLEVGISFGRN